MSPPTIPLHRIRFYDHTPSPITLISFSPLPLPPIHTSSSNPSISKTHTDGSYQPSPLFVARETVKWKYGNMCESPNGYSNWFLQKILPPTLTHQGISTMTLVIRDPEEFWTKGYDVPKVEDLRLFVSSSDSDDLVERCLHTGRILNTYPIPSPPLWSISVSPTHSLLCLSTTSSSLHFLSITPDGLSPPSHLLRCDPLPSRVRTVSIAWGPPELIQIDNQWNWKDTYVVTGNSDSSFRKWELPQLSHSSTIGSAAGSNRVTLKSRAVVEKISKGGNTKLRAGQKGTIVWGIAVLPDGGVVTSDSLGSVVFWDGKTMAQRQSFGAHKADGMCLVVGPGGKTIYTSGPDQRICQFVLLPPSSPSSPPTWTLTSSRRMHTHDIRSLSIFPPYVCLPNQLQSYSTTTTNTPESTIAAHPSDSIVARPDTRTFPRIRERRINPNHSPILASGGWDMHLSLLPASEPSLISERLKNPLGKPGKSRVVFEDALVRRLSPLSEGRVSVAEIGRLILGRRDRGVGVWRVKQGDEGWEKVLEMDFKLRTNLISSSISPDGRWIVVSDLYEPKLFLLDPSTTPLKPKRIKSLPDLLNSHPSVTKNSGASTVMFTPDNKRLVLGLVSGEVVVLDLPSLKHTPIHSLNTLHIGQHDFESELLHSDVHENGHSGDSEDQANDSSEEKREGLDVKIVGVFKCETSGKVLRGKPTHNSRLKMSNGLSHIHANGVISGTVNGDEGQGEDESMDVDRRDSSEDENDGDEDVAGDLKVRDRGRGADTGTKWVSCLTASSDGQWTAVAVGSWVGVYNLDTMRLYSTLPTFPSSPITLSFPPSHPSLLFILLPTHTLEIYHPDSKSFLPSTKEVDHLNEVLKGQYLPVTGMVFSPTIPSHSVVTSSQIPTSQGKTNDDTGENDRLVKVVFWSGEWIVTARLDLDSILRPREKIRKRSRRRKAMPTVVNGVESYDEGNEPGERDGTGGMNGIDQVDRVSGKNGVEKIHGLGEIGEMVEKNAMKMSGERIKLNTEFRCVVGVGWFSSSNDVHLMDEGNKLGEEVSRGERRREELVIVERPWSDYANELPAVFFTGGFGRA
ncbi:hypothetical protein TREMEDRAFT_71590 [Tremella mesenterica DSM 1558]|uniref:uncharacterized protein n=1 Tax=Tremella mesenterica (strain ATCC 24925 / CBS 8224 / DSM 1558 / NBRC 9311 / NRRL Y-6157 / RJB 2259-6 / UBC 559-6) TaxID=578456 RepID=UPI0003F49924|nr:uncharacterized protein TREMEDRAFT_71590 [Tremella mesenterica DSM 1558]EIW69257.1 hypothetical protein TREMEDRAFT_71590 [Tremella mesenterica DSM 1558]